MRCLNASIDGIHYWEEFSYYAKRQQFSVKSENAQTHRYILSPETILQLGLGFFLRGNHNTYTICSLSWSVTLFFSLASNSLQDIRLEFFLSWHCEWKQQMIQRWMCLHIRVRMCDDFSWRTFHIATLKGQRSRHCVRVCIYSCFKR